MNDVLNRIGAVNPVPGEPPAAAWTASILLDEINARRGQATQIDESETFPAGLPTPSRGVRIAAAAGAFVLVVAVLGTIGLIANGGGSEVLNTPTEEFSSTTDAISLGESFYTAFLRGDWNAANELGEGVLDIGVPARQFHGNDLWEIDVVDIDCVLVTELLVECTSTQTDVLTRQVSATQTWQAVGTMLVVDDVVTWYTFENEPSPFQPHYESWLDIESPGSWLFSECTHGGYLSTNCFPIYVANIDAWLATDPDLGHAER